VRPIKREFFSRKNLIQAGWALLIALIAFIGSQFVDVFKGPQQVIVEGNRRVPDTMIVRVSSDESSQAGAMVTLLDSLRIAIRGIQIQGSKGHSTDRSPKSDALRGANKIQLKSFRLPKGGYLQRTIDAYATSICPQPTATVGDVIECRFKLLGNIETKLLSPAILSVFRRDQSGRSVSYLFDQQYELKNDSNLIVFAASFPPGDYEVEFGFFRLDELDTKYPPFYSRRCAITLKAN
jgi:hypothetical protein